MSKRRNPSPAWRVQASSNLSFCVIHNWLRLRMVVPNARCTVDILGKATIYFPRIACVRANAFVISSACKKWHHDVAEPRFGSAHKSKLKRHRELYCRLIQDQTLRWRGEEILVQNEDKSCGRNRCVVGFQMQKQDLRALIADGTYIYLADISECECISTLRGSRYMLYFGT